MPVFAPTNRARRRDLILLGVAVVVAVILATVLVIRHVGADDAVTPPPSDVGSAATPPPPVATAPQHSLGPLGDLARRQPDDPLAQGSVTAPIVLIEFADMRCPFCAQFSRQTEPVLVERYVDAGLLRIEWRDMAIFGPQSTDAARAARAAAAQGRFWPFIQTVYAAAPPKGHPDLTAAALHDFARQAGVPNLNRFDADAASTRYDAAIHADLMQARSLGIPSTPAFSINGHPVLGAQPTDTFTNLIDDLAAGKNVTP
ncbi:DsbA family protein [Mycolicibacterium sp. J2]|uniref:DsbA family protein n=1 Tax=Mycolicibacterium sp. J2 TaxID=2993511 RepID=UPI00224A7FCD|nr:thioredoxin domain-containing protein [Mycolicibacterium sp. J2]MCX2715730.1 thioredoxin domain-containing protein [Mycolicibacterium sp. J2]